VIPALKLENLTKGTVAKSTRKKDLFDAVLERYRLIHHSLHPVVCSAFDNDAPTRSQKLSFDHVDFAADVKSAVVFAFRGRSDRTQLEDAMDVIVGPNDEVRASLDPLLNAKVARLCSPVFAKRGLDPAMYFRRIRHGNRQRGA
jgi:hypothetical protein